MRSKREILAVTYCPDETLTKSSSVTMQQLRPSDPYMHFRTPGSCCFEKLFDADEIARFEREIGGDQEAVGWDEMVGGGVGGWW